MGGQQIVQPDTFDSSNDSAELESELYESDSSTDDLPLRNPAQLALQLF